MSIYFESIDSISHISINEHFLFVSSNLRSEYRLTDSFNSSSVPPNG